MPASLPADPPPDAHEFHLGDLTLVPQGFFELIGEWRSATTADSVSTSFGQIPLLPTSSQWIASPRHSRPMLHATLTLGRVELTTYLESDFMNLHPGQSSFRWRQYWQKMKIGRWELMGGQAWSLLRPNRAGIEPEHDLMNTDVIEPNYQVGLAGARRRQVRLAYTRENWKAALAWEGAYGLWVGKVARDAGSLHLEAGAFTGRQGQRGFTLAQVYKLSPRLRLVGQQFASRHALAEALGVVPRGVSGYSSLLGPEIPITRHIEFFSYGGFVYGERSESNRLVRQFSAGVNHRINRLLLSLQYSRIERSLWSPRQGSMDMLQTRLRFNLN